MLYKIHNRGKDKRKEHENESWTVSYKSKGKKLKFSDNESKSSSRIKVRSLTKKNINILVKEVIATMVLERGNINPMKISRENLKR